MFSSVFDVRNALTPGADEADTSTAASLEDYQIFDAIEQADSRIQGYLPAGYVVGEQTVTVPPDVYDVAVSPFRWWSRDIAAWLVTLTFRRNKDLPVDDPIRLRYEATMVELGMVAEGTFNLPPSSEALPADAYGVVVENLYEGTLFGPEDFNLVKAMPDDMLFYEARARGWAV